MSAESGSEGMQRQREERIRHCKTVLAMLEGVLGRATELFRDACRAELQELLRKRPSRP